jgi:uracil-DNA glycosylase family 4
MRSKPEFEQIIDSFPEGPWQDLESEIITCRACPRLVGWREEVAKTRRRAYLDWEYWGGPVAGFGDVNARVMAVGLAPGAHGSNRTGRMFTGDASGDFLYPALYRAGFASQPECSHVGDGLILTDLFISSVCRCAPPDNKPEPGEIEACGPFLEQEITLLRNLKGFVALGKIGFDYLIRLYRRLGVSTLDASFEHAGLFRPEGAPWIISSYHPSRQNTQTGRLTSEMFDSVWIKAKELIR